MIESPPSTDGTALVEAAMAGDRAALRTLWEHHRRWVAAVIIAHKPAAADTDDLLQEVALTLLAKISTVHDPAAFPGWLRMVALNAARLAGRRAAAAPRLVRDHDHTAAPAHDTHAAGPTAPDAPATLALDQEAQRVMALAMTLPDDYREPLLLKALKGLSYRQIGAILGLPETTVETRIARGRRMLRDKATQTESEPAISTPAARSAKETAAARIS